jgi:hypothetical protein
MDSRERLLQRIGDINDRSRPRPLVTLDEFFDGNDDPGVAGTGRAPGAAVLITTGYTAGTAVRA